MPAPRRVRMNRRSPSTSLRHSRRHPAHRPPIPMSSPPSKPASSPPRRVAVVGGGITGLAAAHRLLELDGSLQVRLFEASDRLGGVLQTERVDGFLVERASDMFITNVPWATDLCRRIGLEDQLISTNEAQRRAFVVRRGRLYPVPEGFALMTTRRPWPILTSRLLSPWGKLRLLWEYFIPQRKTTEDESLASFVRRRFGREAFERLVQPLVAGIYTADAELLSIEATLPRFPEMERLHGGLIRAALREPKNRDSDDSQSGGRYGLFVAPREGMQQLVSTLAARLPERVVQLGCPVHSVSAKPEGGWSLEIEHRAEHPAERAQPLERESFDAVIIAAPAFRAARLLSDFDSELAGDLDTIPYAGAAVVCLGYRREQIAHALNGFGLVVPEIEHRRILAASFGSVKFDGRAPEGHVLLRVFLGGAKDPESVALDDETLRRIACEELGELLGARGEPIFCRVGRYQATMPQYHLGHLERVGEIERRVAEHAGLELAGNAYHGVGIPHSIHSGESAAQRLLDGGDP